MYSQKLTPAKLSKMANQARNKSYKTKNKQIKMYLQGYAQALDDLMRNMLETQEEV